MMLQHLVCLMFAILFATADQKTKIYEEKLITLVAQAELNIAALHAYQPFVHDVILKPMCIPHKNNHSISPCSIIAALCFQPPNQEHDNLLYHIAENYNNLALKAIPHFFEQPAQSTKTLMQKIKNIVRFGILEKFTAPANLTTIASSIILHATYTSAHEKLQKKCIKKIVARGKKQLHLIKNMLEQEMAPREQKKRFSAKNNNCRNNYHFQFHRCTA